MKLLLKSMVKVEFIEMVVVKEVDMVEPLENMAVVVKKVQLEMEVATNILAHNHTKHDHIHIRSFFAIKSYFCRRNVTTKVQSTSYAQNTLLLKRVTKHVKLSYTELRKSYIIDKSYKKLDYLCCLQTQLFHQLPTNTIP